MSGDNFSRRYSVVAEARRRWSEAEKQAIVAEAERPGVNISAMDPEDGRLRVIGIGEDEYTAFTEYGIECLKQIIIDERALLARQATSEA
jgi:hypothetical protein